uniref:Uncharacterized protein n=1 Tax=Knipowitschia caucasica TaxID=637954 RepID=A0AAV2LC08_KNICA
MVVTDFVPRQFHIAGGTHVIDRSGLFMSRPYGPSPRWSGQRCASARLLFQVSTYITDTEAVTGTARILPSPSPPSPSTPVSGVSCSIRPFVIQV